MRWTDISVRRISRHDAIEEQRQQALTHRCCEASNSVDVCRREYEMKRLCGRGVVLPACMHMSSALAAAYRSTGYLLVDISLHCKLQRPEMWCAGVPAHSSVIDSKVTGPGCQAHRAPVR